MKTLLTTGLLCAVIGAAVGWMNAADHYEAKQLKREAAQHAAEKQRNKAIAQLSTDYYAQYQDAINRNPVTVTERVLIRARCPVRADQPASLDDGTGTTRVELDQRSVERVTAVTDKHEKRANACAIQLTALQALIRSQ